MLIPKLEGIINYQDKLVFLYILLYEYVHGRMLQKKHMNVLSNIDGI